MTDEPSPSCRVTVGAVLIVEDNEAYRRITTLRLRSIGLECHEADTHEKALRLLRERSEIKVAVIDYEIRGVGPDDFVACIRKEHPDLRLIGHSNLNRRAEFAALGVHRFMLKPWTPDQLTTLLTSI
ncbi:MAG: response regulator [Planctomycetes bacterium]|nr:response regulator [Planctomycetota bacterium]MBI3834540.1 response regulator [Planctomycetota bacterium]